jgi:hypothetical protein
MIDEEQTQERDTGRDEGDAGTGADGDDEVTKAHKAAEREKEAKKKVEELEENPPEKLEDWPDDAAKYETFGGAEGNEGYEESVTSKLGPSSLRYREDGKVEIEGDEVDNPDEYKGEPIPGGPTDPKLGESRAYGEPDLTEETSIDPEDPPERGEKGDGDSAEEGESGGDSSAREQS